MERTDGRFRQRPAEGCGRTAALTLLSFHVTCDQRNHGGTSEEPRRTQEPRRTDVNQSQHVSRSVCTNGDFSGSLWNAFVPVTNRRYDVRNFDLETSDMCLFGGGGGASIQGWRRYEPCQQHVSIHHQQAFRILRDTNEHHHNYRSADASDGFQVQGRGLGGWDAVAKGVGGESNTWNSITLCCSIGGFTFVPHCK